MDEEVGKYVKKKKSNTSKVSKKSKHKHIYKECLLTCDFLKSNRIALGSYCIICGRIGGRKIEHNKIMDDDGNFQAYRSLTNEEILEKHKSLPLFRINDFSDKSVSIVENI